MMKTTIENLKAAIFQQNEDLKGQKFHGQLSLEVSTENPQKVTLYRDSMYSSGRYYRIKTRVAPDMSPEQAMLWLDRFSPETYGFDRSLPEFLPFPNGFEQWHRTHFYIIGAMDTSRAGSRSASYNHDRYPGLVELAEDLTNDFEGRYKGRIWANDYLSTLVEFCISKNL